MKQQRIHTRWYAAGDFAACVLAWILFYFTREYILGESFIAGPKFYLGLFIYPLAWMALYLLTGSYYTIYHKSRLTEFIILFAANFIGSIIVAVATFQTALHIAVQSVTTALTTLHFTIQHKNVLHSWI